MPNESVEQGLASLTIVTDMSSILIEVIPPAPPADVGAAAGLGGVEVAVENENKVGGVGLVVGEEAWDAFHTVTTSSWYLFWRDFRTISNPFSFDSRIAVLTMSEATWCDPPCAPVRPICHLHAAQATHSTVDHLPYLVGSVWRRTLRKPAVSPPRSAQLEPQALGRKSTAQTLGLWLRPVRSTCLHRCLSLRRRPAQRRRRLQRPFLVRSTGPSALP